MTTTPADLLADLERAAAQVTTEAEAVALRGQITETIRLIKADKWKPYPWQHPHVHEHDDPGKPSLCTVECLDRARLTIPTQGMWLQLGGRGTGKTEGAARYVDEHASGPPCDERLPGGHRILIVGPTMTDATEACYHGPSGLHTINPTTVLRGGSRGLNVYWPTGSVARVTGCHTAEDVERLRAAGNRCLVWLEEAAAQRHLDIALEQATLGLRIGSRPHFVGSTTPKGTKAIRALIADPTVIITKGRTAEAIHLDPAVRATYERKYGGTRLGRQELDADVLEDVEGALWTHELVEASRVGAPGHPPAPEAYHRVVVTVDPPGGSTEAGIMVCGSIGDEGYVIKDLSGEFPPSVWAQKAVDAFRHYGAEVLGVETAYGGDMVANTIHTVDPTIPIVRVPTKVGKRLRAEPIVAIFEQARAHIVGSMPETEDQMTGWVPDDTPESPDRLDAMVHGLTYLLVTSRQGSVGTAAATGRVIQGSWRPVR